MQPNRFPFILGVSGHRDIAPAEMGILATRTREVMNALCRLLPHSPVTVLTALADGADQLAATMACELGLQTIAIAPMPRDDYRQTIANKVGFDELWKRADMRLELPWLKAASDLSPEDRHKQQYAALGVVLTRYSHLLLAYWNGADAWQDSKIDLSSNQGLGGTAHVVHMMRNGRSFQDTPDFLYRTPERPHLVIDDGSPVIRISCGRTNSSLLSTEAPGTLSLLSTPDSTIALASASELETNLANQPDWIDMDAANASICATALIQDKLAATASQLLSDKQLSALPAGHDEAGWLRTLFATTDRMAMRNQLLILRAHVLLVCALPLGVLLYEFYTHVFHYHIAALAAYTAIVLASLFFYGFFVARRRWQKQYQDFRALAEALRVQLYWALGSVSDPVIEHYLSNHRGALSWLRSALRGAGLQALALSLKQSRPNSDLVRDGWIKDQMHFFIGTQVVKYRQHAEQPERFPARLLNTLMTAFVWISKKPAGGKAEFHESCYKAFKARATIAYGLAVVATLALFIPELLHVDHETLFLKLWVVGIAFLPAVAGALTIFSEQRAFEDQAHEYARMGQLFALADNMIDRVKTDEEYRALLRELGREALAENAAWLMLHRKRPIEVVMGG